MKIITIEYILNNEFAFSGLEDVNDRSSSSCKRFSSGQLKLLPKSDESKMLDLKVEIDNILLDKKLSTSRFEYLTSLKMNSLRKTINRSTGKVKRETLAKFVVGLKIDMDSADRLFSLESTPLNPEHILLDAIVVHCLQNRYGIEEFYDTCEQVGLSIIAAE